MINSIKPLIGIICVAFALTVSAHTELPDFSKLVKQSSGAIVNVSIVRHLNSKNQTPSEGDLQLPGEDLHQWPDFLHKFFEYYENNPDSMPFDTESIGSGFIISEDGYVVTNSHVVDNADEIIIKLQDRRELMATVVGSDKHSDIALLKVEANDLPTVKMGMSDALEPGQWVAAIGSPFGFDYSVTAGIVSAVNRTLPSASYVSFIQTDVAVNPGNSGGPLFNMQGKVVGINSHIYSRTGGFMGLSFAIPSELVIHVVDQLKKKGSVTRGWLGVYIQEITRELSESLAMDKPQGVLVSGLTTNSPAHAAGVEVGDVIHQYNGKIVEHVGLLPPMVGYTEPGSVATLSVLRNGKVKKIKVTIGQLPEEEQEQHFEKSKPTGSKANVATLGISVREMRPEEKESSKVPNEALVVDKVMSGAGRQAGLQKGDLLLLLNNQQFSGVEDFTKIAANLPTDQFVIVLIMRNGMTRFLALKTPAESE